MPRFDSEIVTRWITCNCMYYSKVFQSYQDNREGGGGGGD